ncbi:MAG TPA: STAS domain-containing protein [Acidimicrobiales bacterium]
MQDNEQYDILNITVSQADGQTLISLAGELVLSSAPLLLGRMHEAIDAGASKVVCDLKDLTYMDSTGLNVFLMRHKRMGAADGTLIIASPRPNVRRVFEVTGVDSYLNLE